MRLQRARYAICAAAVLLSLACADDAADVASGSEPPTSAVQEPAPLASAEWPTEGLPIDVRRERHVDFTQNGVNERVAVTARGPAYDALDVDLAIIDAAGDTLWLERWSSMHYFRYTPIEELADTAVATIVRDHVDDLLADASFAAAGLPDALSHGDARTSLREAVVYHLAELDWRAGADLQPVDPTPPDAHSRIRVDNVAPERVDVVIDEVLAGPVFMYYAGGEATYAIGWSEREHAFVRLYSCC